MKQYIIRKKQYQYDDSKNEDYYSSKFFSKHKFKQDGLLELNKLENEAYIEEANWIYTFSFKRYDKPEETKNQLIDFINNYPAFQFDYDGNVDEDYSKLEELSIRDLCQKISSRFENYTQIEAYRKIWDVQFYELMEFEEDELPYTFIAKLYPIDGENPYCKHIDSGNILQFSSPELLEKYYFEKYDFTNFCDYIATKVVNGLWSDITDYQVLLEDFFIKTTHFQITEMISSDDKRGHMRDSEMFQYQFRYDKISFDVKSELNTLLGLLKMKLYEVLKVTDEEYEIINTEKTKIM